MQLLNWQSDGVGAGFMLALYGIILAAIVLRRAHRIPTLARLIPAACFWHLVTWAFIAFWLVPHYMSTAQVDAAGYHDEGMRVANYIRSGDWGDITWSLGSDTIPLVTGLLYAPFGGEPYGIMLFSSALGLCGSLYLCMAFGLWATPATSKRYAVIVLFLPSFVTWTSVFGKDSWVALGIGLAAYGYASMLKARALAGLWHFIGGLVILAAIRPHIAVVLVMSMAVAYIWGITQSRRGSIFVKSTIIIVLITTSAALATVLPKFLGISDISAGGIEEYAAKRGEGNAAGGSSVEVQTAPGVAGAILAFPRSIVRILFEPFPWEAHNLNAGLAAAENLFILWLTLSVLPRIRELYGGIAREPYLLFSLVFTAMMLLMLSFTPNLGLISRQRAQLLPSLFAILVAAKHVRKRRLVPSRTFAEYPYQPAASEVALPSVMGSR